MPSRRTPKRTLTFSELSQEHQAEVVGNLGPKAALGTVWEFVPDFPVDHAAALVEHTSIQVFDEDVESLEREIKRRGKVTRPILIDELDEDGVWMEGRHRSIASERLGLKVIPALYRIK